MCTQRLVRSLFALMAFASLSGCIIAQGGFEEQIFIEAGESMQLSLGLSGCCYFIIPVSAPATWSIESGAPATLNPATGLLQINEDAPDGASFTIHAGNLSSTVTVYSLETRPFLGYWREEGQRLCDSSEERTPTWPIEEIRFLPNGEFSVTWMPFEVYKDYWGTYTFDAETRTITLSVEDGNFIPEGIDGTGTFALDDAGQLILSDLWLGINDMREEPSAPSPGCGHRLSRTWLLSDFSG